MPTDNSFINIDAARLRDDIIERMEAKTGELMYPGDERRIFAESIAYIIATAFSAANEQCKARTLPYAHGYQLDALGTRVGCTRAMPTPGRLRLTFTLDTARPFDILVPAGTTVTADNNVVFATDETAAIPAGCLCVENVPATSTAGGSITNGIPAGAVQTFVDRLPYVSGVINTTASSGGDDGEPYPLAIDPEHGDDGTGDDSYRERIKLAVATFSCAGSESAYEYYARSASSNIEDVMITSDQEAGTVDIYITETGGAMPSEGTLAAVTAAVTDDAVKPLNDLVRVHAPEAVDYNIELVYYVTAAEEAASVEAIEGEGGLLDQYNAWQQGKIGRDISPQRLMAYLLSSCLRLDVAAPAFVRVNKAQIARFSGNITITHTIVDE